MDLLLVVVAASVTLLLLAVALGLIVLNDSTANVRLTRFARAAALPRGGDRGARMAATLQRIGAVAGRGSLEGAARASLRLRLVQAGYYADRAVEGFFAIRVVTALGLGLLAMVAVLVLRPPGPLLGLLMVLFASAIGLYLPNLLLGQRIKARRLALRIGLPDAVDLMVTCLEAGGTLTSAMQRVTAEFRDLHPVICEHLGIVLMEMQAGSSRADALTRLGERAASDEISALVTMLVQSEALGASVAQTMRVFSEQTRQARYLDAERRASELPVKLSLPLVLFIFPSLMTVIFTPLIIRIFRVLLQNT